MKGRTKKAVARSHLSVIFNPPMARTAGKSKTHKAISKRVRVTGTGKMLRQKQGKRHLLLNKNRKRKRNLGKATLISSADLPRFRENLPFSH